MAWNASGCPTGGPGRVRCCSYTGYPTGVCAVKKGRHRRFEEARALKRTNIDLEELLGGPARDEPCPECGCEPRTEHASWCMFEETDDED